MTDKMRFEEKGLGVLGDLTVEPLLVAIDKERMKGSLRDRVSDLTSSNPADHDASPPRCVFETFLSQSALPLQALPPVSSKFRI